MNNKNNNNKSAVVEALKSIAEAFGAHKIATAQAFAKYRKAMKEIDERYSEAYAAKKREETRQQVRIDLEVADMRLSHEIRAYSMDLRNEIDSIVTNPIPANLWANVQAYHSMNLKMSEIEIKAYARQTFDNLPALKVFAEVARKSGFNVSIPSIDRLADDIREIERASFYPTMYVPEGFLHEALELLPDVPVFNAYGQVIKGNGRPDAAYLASRASYFDSLAGRIKNEMPDRWQHVHPTVEKVDPEEYSSKEEAAEAQAELERKAVDAHVDALRIKPDINAAVKADAARQAKAERRGKDILGHYK